MTIVLPARDRTALLAAAVRDLAAARSVGDIVEIVRHAARQLVEADGATFVLRDGEYCHYVDEDAIEPLWRGQRFPLESCISGWAMLHGEAVAIPDIYVDARVPQDAYRPTFVRSLVMTPVRSAEAFAAIGTYWANEHVATAHELETLQALADTTAVAFENVRVIEELEARVRERTADLAAANRDLRSFAHIAAHDLRNPLLTTGAYIELALKTDRANLSADGIEFLEGARAANERMGRLLEAVLGYSTAGEQQMARAVVDLNAVVESVQRDLAALIAQRNARVTVAELPKAKGNEMLLERALQNLIANAITYGDETQPTVDVRGGTTNATAWVSVSDNGAGVPESERDAIFEMFTRGKSGRAHEGFGIGLAFVARVAERLGGTVTVTDNAGGGATFTLTLPGA